MEDRSPRAQSSSLYKSASSCSYVSEGGQHVVFAEGSGRLLRIDKAVFRGIPPASSSSSSLHSLLHPYVDLPERVWLDRSGIDSLRAAAREHIPSRRRRDWEVACLSEENGGPGSLLPDYRGRSGICVEIKPKGGYITKSPFLEERRRHKYGQSRYVLLQQLYREGKLNKDWMNEDAPPPVSAYDPVDLFSGNAVRMRQALHHLLQCPQNNLQIWQGRQKLLGDPKSRSSMERDHCVRQALELPFAADGEDGMAWLVEIVVRVLLQEPLLSRILALQKLDLLDTDGANLVFSRLVQLCDNNEEKAEALLNEFPEWRTNSDPPNTIPLLEFCPLPLPAETTQLTKLCTEIAQCEEKNDPSVLPNARQALQTLHSLSLDECQYLLQAWLISLTMCDVTFFLHLEPASPTEFHAPESLRVPTVQQHHAPGRMFFSPANTELQYTIKVIDVDLKPARKIRSRNAKESQFDRPTA